MKLKTVYKLAVVLSKSQVRGTQRGKTLARIFGDPQIFAVVDVAVLLGLGVLGYLVSAKASPDLRGMIVRFVPQALTGVPSAIMFMMIVFGVLYEVSQPIQSLSTDLVNWLPISPLEYVGGSTLSEVYIYSLILCALLGLLLGPALLLGMGTFWVATVFMSIIALFTGACVVEILDAVTNRISSSFYKKSGRSGIFFRLAVTIILLSLIQLTFSGYIINYLFQTIIHAESVAWFVPVVWPSLAVLGLTEANIVNFASFSSLSIVFAACLLVLAAQFRERFWVPVPVSIKLTTRTYRPGKTSLPFIGGAESALIQKDFRSLTRRREMARFLAIPFVIAISMGISMFPMSTQSGGPNLDIGLFILLIPIAIFVSIISMASIGQEGSAVWNLYAAPIKPSQLLRAKMLFASGLGLVFGLVLLLVFTIILPTFGAYYWIPLVLVVPLVLEESARGMYIAARFPDFREMVRSRYVGVWAQLTGSGLSFIIPILAMTPIWLEQILYGSIGMESVLVGFLILAALFIVELKLASGQMRSLLQNIRV